MKDSLFNTVLSTERVHHTQKVYKSATGLGVVVEGG